MSQDPEDAKPPVQIGRKHSFRGKQLAPFSWGAEATMYRVIGGKPTPFEEYTYTIYLLLAKTPQQMDALRTEEQISAFRIEAGEWADREKLGAAAGWKEISELANAIIKERQDAASIVPVPPKPGKTKPGNA